MKPKENVLDKNRLSILVTPIFDVETEPHPVKINNVSLACEAHAPVAIAGIERKMPNDWRKQGPPEEYHDTRRLRRNVAVLQ